MSEPLQRVVGRLISALLVVIVIAGVPSANAANCRARAGTANLAPGEQFVGMFEVELVPPLLGDPAAAQRHLALATIWGNVLSSELNRTTRGTCSARFTPYAFPNMRAFVANLQTNRLDQAKAICGHALADILQHPQADERSIKQAISWAALSMEPARPSSRGTLSPTLDASNILGLAYRKIYEPNTLLHALTSVPWRDYRSIPIPEYQAWVQSQTNENRPRLKSIPDCFESSQPRGWVSDPTAASLRALSGTVPPGEIRIRRSDGAIPLGPLRYAVVVSDVDGLIGFPPEIRYLTATGDIHTLSPVSPLARP
ncbi:hypothetical protein CI41S_52100 [Bradyrhizobium ivorense]|nr:hypothetical protein CI41S_52100 [Bradyrhizobium ivorense]